MNWPRHPYRTISHIPRCLLCRELLHGRRHQVQPKKQYKDTIKTNYHWCKIRPKELDDYVADRLHWHTTKPLQASKKPNIKKYSENATLAMVMTPNFQCSTTPDVACPEILIVVVVLKKKKKEEKA